MRNLKHPDLRELIRVEDIVAPNEQLRDARLAKRRCQECQLCNRHIDCGWMQGLLLDEHKPSQWGMIVGATKVEGEGKSTVAMVLREGRGHEGAGQRQDVMYVARLFAQHALVFVVNGKHEIGAIMGPEPLVALVKPVNVEQDGPPADTTGTAEAASAG